MLTRYYPKTRARAFISDRGGVTVILTALLIPFLFTAIYTGINITRIMNAKLHLRNAIDAAVTSTAREIFSGELTSTNDEKERIRQFFLANAKIEMAIPNTIDVRRINIDRNSRTIHVEAEAELDMPFWLDGFVVPHSKVISVDTTTRFSYRTSEVVLALDVSSSMAGGRLSSLKSAARKAIRDLLANNSKSMSQVRIAIVPYSSSVNAGPLANYIFAEVPYYSHYDPQYVAPPTDSESQSFIIRGDGTLGACSYERMTRDWEIDYTDNGPDIALVNGTVTYCPLPPLVPLTSDESALYAAIDNLVAAGGTAGQVAIEWGWYLLSPKWAPYLPKKQKPGPYNHPEVKKYLVLMTDGAFSFSTRDLEATDIAKRFCDQMKNDGIEIFSISFMVYPYAANPLPYCASPDAPGLTHYFDASSTIELNAAFEKIAESVQRLNLI